MSWLIHKLKTDYPSFTFSESEDFSWSAHQQTVSYNPHLPHAPLLLLHEVSHALLDHHEYRRDIELISMEVAAWEKAQKLASMYGIQPNEDVTQDHLDTYRDWLHSRSTCPDCKATGYQTASVQYQCPACTHRWKVNEARVCALRRYSVTT